jgi:hypothetical protein
VRAVSGLVRRRRRSVIAMDTPPIIWEFDKTTGAFVAAFADHPKRLASVRLQLLEPASPTAGEL